jgi:hypothetical protein
MASQSSKTERGIPFAMFAADIERRRIASGVTDLPRNSGTRRTQNKRALLGAIKDAGGAW